MPPGARAAGVISREASRSPRAHAGRGCGRGARRGGAGARAPPPPEVRAQAAGGSPWAAGPPGLGGRVGARSPSGRASRLRKEGFEVPR